MGGFFGAATEHSCISDVFFGTDYHSHLGTRRGGMTAYSAEKGFQRSIHSIENSPFRTKFESDVEGMSGNLCIGSISDTDPQPILLKSRLGTYAVCNIGIINNDEELCSELLSKSSASFETMSSGKVNSSSLIGALIAQKDNIVDGIRYAQEKIQGTMSLLILTEDGIIAARDKDGRLPIIIGRRDDGYCVSFESFAFQKLGYDIYREMLPGEIVKITSKRAEVLSEGCQKNLRICTFLWTYYGYPNSYYEGINVEVMRNRNGALLAKRDSEVGHSMELDYVSGVPDSGTPHAIGYANTSGIPFARPFIKYTPTWPRSFMPNSQKERNHVAKMKMVPVHDLIEGKRLLFVDDSIVRGTQLGETVRFLYENGAKEVHMRSACPPIMYGCKYLNFSRSTSEMDLIARRAILKLEGEAGTEHIEEYLDGRTERGKAMRKCICEELHFDSLEYQSLDNLIEAIGLPACKLCTYCWNGKE